MQHFHNCTEPQCNSNYPFEDSDDAPVRHRAEIKDDRETEREREARERQSNERAGGRVGRQEEGEGESHKENNVLVKC